MYPGQDISGQNSNLILEFDTSKDNVLSYLELMKAFGGSSYKAGLLFPGVNVREWTPPKEDS
jgi:hypothetical protein